jgi:hypothetical protein
MNNCQTPVHDLSPGGKIEHDLMPGFVMDIQGVRSCKTDFSRPEPHAAYKVTDPGGNDNWVCAYDVHAAT